MNEERFIKLTQIDGRSIWVNARYLVTVEPRKGSGALVVPLGDGMDYEVKESPETVIALCCGETVAAPERKPLKPEPASNPAVAAPVSPVAESAVAEAAPAKPSESVPATASAPAEAPVEKPDAETDAHAPKKAARKSRATKTPSTRTRKTVAKVSKTELSETPAADVSAAEPPAAIPETPVLPTREREPSADRSAEILRKVAKMACRSRNRLLNTLKSQFSLSEEKCHEMMSSWVDQGHITIDGNGHVEWKK